MLKAAFPLDIAATIFSVVICMMAIFTAGLGLVSQMKVYADFVESGIEDMNSVDIANMIEACFAGEENHYIEWSFLQYNDGKDVCAICQLCSLDIGLKVTDFEKETDNNWFFGFEGSKGIDHEIFVNIKDGSEIHLGRMYVQIL